MDRYAYRASEIGVIFQSFNLMPSMTVSENIAMSMKLAGAWHGRTVIIVTHSAEVASACDDVFDLSLFKKRTRPRKARRARRPAAATGRA